MQLRVARSAVFHYGNCCLVAACVDAAQIHTRMRRAWRSRDHGSRRRRSPIAAAFASGALESCRRRIVALVINRVALVIA